MNTRQLKIALLVLTGLAVILAGCQENESIQGAVTPGSANEAVAAAETSGKKREKPPQRAPSKAAVTGTPVEVQRVTRRDFSLEATYIGHLLPRERVELRSEVEGAVEKMFFEEGQQVARGDKLAHISTRQFTLRRDLAKADLDLAESDYRRTAQLFRKKLVSAVKRDLSRNKRIASVFRLKLAELDLEKSRVRTPIDGTVKTRAAEEGEFLNKGQLIAEILDLSKVRVLFHVPEKEIRHIAAGKPVQVRLDALPGLDIPGNVALVGLEADLSNRSFPVEVELDNPQGRLLPGMLARVQVRLETHRAQVLVPRFAILEREDGRVVYLAKGNRAVERHIETGASPGERVQVLKGLSGGERLIVTGQQKLIPNEKIRIVRVLP